MPDLSAERRAELRHTERHRMEELRSYAMVGELRALLDMADRCEELEYEATERSALKRSFDEIADRCESMEANLKRAVEALEYPKAQGWILAAELRERWFAEEENSE